MSTREQCIQLLDLLPEGQLSLVLAYMQGMLAQMEYDLPNAETLRAMDHVSRGIELSKGFTSVEKLMEDLNADD